MSITGSVDNVLKVWEEMVQAYRAGELERADRLGRELIESEPRHVKALHLLSVIAYRQKSPDRELKYLKLVIAVDPEHVEALNGAANLLRVKGNIDEAVRLLRRALQHNPTYANAHNSLGLCRMALKNAAEAAKSFQRAIDLDPGLEAAKQNLRVALSRLEKLPSSERATLLAPSTAEDFEYLAHLNHGKKRRREAIECYKRALKVDPNSPRLLVLLADNERQQGLSREAITHLNEALAIDPHISSAYAQMGFALQDLGEFDEATEAFERSISLRPIQGVSYLGLVTTRRIQKDEQSLVDRIAGLIMEPGLPPAERLFLHTALSKAKDDLGEYEAAVTQMDEANRIALTEMGSTLPFNREAFEREVTLAKTTYTKEFFAQRTNMGTETELPVLFVGLPRSGTTLLEQILSAHPAIAAGGEIRFWADEGATSSEGLNVLAYDREGPQRLASEYLKLLECIGSSAKRVTDKMPDNFVYLGLIHMLLPGARFIHCHRNPLDTCVSLYMTPFRNRPPVSYRREDILSYCRVCERLMEHWKQVIPSDRLLQVNYEDVVANPESATRKVVSFLGLEWDDACLRHDEVRRVVNTPSNWQSRQKIYDSSVERWRRYEPWLGVFEELRSGVD